MEIKFFYLPGCPYCRRARKIIDELRASHPEFSGVSFDEINEITDSAIADQYDYWHVPAFFAGNRKLYEAQPGDDEVKMKNEILAVFEGAMAEK